MKFNLDGLDVFFPYPAIYPEQYEYMLELKRSLDAKGHCMLEMPTGTGKTVSLLSLITSYQFAKPETGKLIYCTRTVPEMQKCLNELKQVISHRDELLGTKGSNSVLAVCLSSRRNMCIHPDVMAESDRERVDALCRKKTASWVRANGSESDLCSFYEDYMEHGSEEAFNEGGVYTLDDMKELAREKGYCPYFFTRHILSIANVVVYNYQYMLDPKVAGMVSKELAQESIVVFDEAHNIDNVCIEALSVEFNRRNLEAASANIRKINSKIAEKKRVDEQKLIDEVQRLIAGLPDLGPAANAALTGTADQARGNPILPADIVNEAVPEKIREAEHFTKLLDVIVKYLKSRIRVHNVEKETPFEFLNRLEQATKIEAKPLRFTYTRLNSLLRTLEVVDLEEFTPLTWVADFLTLVATPAYKAGFMIIIEPFDPQTPRFIDPIFRLACLDASLAIKPVLNRFQTVVITSGTLSPIDLYPTILNFKPVVRRALPMSIIRPCICPMVVTRGIDQSPITSSYTARDDPSVVRNYGSLLVDLARIIPDGIVCFFTSYSYMETVVAEWHESGILRKVLNHKLLFIETKDIVETTLALDNYRRACDCGKGAVFLSVARGKVSEGIDFDRHYGRAVVLFGVPFQYTKSHVLLARLEYLRNTFQISEADFLSFDALRQAAQCVGRVIRSKVDYGLMILADKRFNQPSKRNKLPPWITQFLDDKNLNLSSEDAVTVCRSFLRTIAQPLDDSSGNSSLLTEADLRERRAKVVQDLQSSGMSGYGSLPQNCLGQRQSLSEIQSSLAANAKDKDGRDSTELRRREEPQLSSEQAASNYPAATIDSLASIQSSILSKFKKPEQSKLDVESQSKQDTSMTLESNESLTPHVSHTEEISDETTAPTKRARVQSP